MEVDVQNGVQIAGVGQGSSGALILGPRRFIPFILVIVLTVAAVVTAVLSTGSPAGGATTVRAALASMMDAKSVTFERFDQRGPIRSGHRPRCVVRGTRGITGEQTPDPLGVGAAEFLERATIDGDFRGGQPFVGVRRSRQGW